MYSMAPKRIQLSNNTYWALVPEQSGNTVDFSKNKTKQKSQNTHGLLVTYHSLYSFLTATQSLHNIHSLCYRVV